MFYSVPESIFDNTLYINANDTVFTVSGNDSNPSNTIAVYENGYGLPNFKSKRNVYASELVDSNGLFGTFSLEKIYNSITNKTFYVMESIGNSKEHKELLQELEIYDDKGNKMIFLDFKDSKKFNSNSKLSSYYYVIDTGEPREDFSINLFNENYSFRKIL